jgi:hypothetical protein
MKLSHVESEWRSVAGLVRKRALEARSDLAARAAAPVRSA